jgi:hypothetical protein
MTDGWNTVDSLLANLMLLPATTLNEVKETPKAQ